MPLVPDIAVIKGMPFAFIPSWYVGQTGPAPQVVFEIASEKTWKRDLKEKPDAYARLGVQEYYAYDPNLPPLPLSRQKGRRLFGWHRERTTGRMRELELRSDGSLWSPHLDSFVTPQGHYLRLFDRSGSLRLTEAERARIFAEKLRSLGIDPEQLL